MADCVWIGEDPSESVELYRSLACNMQSGVAYCRMLFEDGKPMDFVYLMVNRAFTAQTGFHDVVGKKATEVIQEIKEGDPEVFGRYAQVALSGKPDRFEVHLRLSGKWFLVSLYSPKPEHFVAILDNITEREKAEERERRTTSIYHALSATNEAILKLKSIGELYPYVCRIAVEYGGMSHAWIGVPDAEGRFVPVGRCGRFADPTDPKKLIDPSYQITVLATPDRPEGRGPSGIAFRENRTVVVNDILGDERLAPWHELAKRDGTRSMAAFPVVKGGRPYGVFSVYSDQSDVFDDETVALLESVANNLSFALDNLERETLLRESEARFRQLADAMPQLVWAANPDGKVDYYNERLHEYRTDFTCNEEGIFEWIRIVHPDDIDASVRAWEHAVETGETYEMEQRVLRADGFYRWHITRAAPVRNENGQIVKWFGTSTDIHELKSAQEALIKGEERFRTLFENAGDGIFIGDMAGQLVDVNASGAQMLGYSREEVRKLKVREILTEPERSRVPDNWEGWEVGNNAVSEWVFLRKDGSTFEGEVNSQLLPDGRIMGILRDVTERRRMLAALEEKEQLLRLFIESAPAAIAMFDREMRYLAFSRRFIEDYHLTEDNLIGRSHYEIFPEVPERWREFHRRCLAGETIHMDEDSFVRADGRVDWIRWEIKPWYSGDAVGGMLMFSEVITERKKAEEEKTQLSAQRQLALDAAQMGWWRTDLMSGTTSYDQRFQEIFSFTDHRPCTSEEFMARLHPDDLPGLLAKIKTATNPDEPSQYESEHRIILPDGSVRWVKSYGMVMFEGEGRTRQATSVVGTVADITAQHQAQEAIRENEAKYRMLFERSLDAIFLAEPSGRIFEANAAACSMLGMSQEEIIQSGRQGFVEDTPALHTALEERARTGIMPAAELTFMRKDGTRLAVEATSVVFGDRPDNYRSLIIARDITERIKNETILKESEEKYRTLVESAADAYFVHELSGQIIEVNRMACESLGYTREELLSMNVFQDIEQDVDAEQAKEWTASLNPGQILTIQGHHRHKDGHIFPVEVRASFLMINGQKRFTSLVRNITERQKTEEELKLAAAVYRDSSEAMMVLDEHRNIIMVNQAFTNITGYEAADVIGQHPRLLRIGHPDDPLYKEDDAFYQDMWRQADKTGRFKGEIWNKRKDGQFIAVQLTVNVIAGESGLPRRYVVLESDITEKKRSDDLIWSQANFDTLTGLPNRRFFRDRLEHEIRNAKRSKLPLALLFIDLDGFKDVNDTLGHDMGDVLLKEAAERLYHCVRESDTVARLGGDEFTVILTELHDPGNADRVARHILKALSEPVKLGEELAYVSASIGITLFPNDSADVEGLIRNADQAMYEAKQHGKNQYQYFTSAMQRAAIKRMRMVNDMRTALERNQFEIMYQPIVELSTGAIRKAEALIRWRHPRRGLVNPVEFISAAEDTGMITSFGDWVFHEAAKQAVLWRERHHPDFQISVNISPVQFKKEGIDPAVWLEHLKGLDLPGRGIVVEITEGLLMDAGPKVKDQLLMLRDAGIEVALDDFGTGYSSLAYLKRFDIDYLKIDQAFIRNLTLDSDDMALCEAIIVMAHKLGLRVIAEGIETDSQRSLLENARCDFAQGYLFSKPVNAEEFERLMGPGPN